MLFDGQHPSKFVTDGSFKLFVPSVVLSRLHLIIGIDGSAQYRAVSVTQS